MNGLDRVRKSLTTNRRAVTTVELAIIAPVVILLLIGMVDLGVAVYSSNTLAEAVRAGARYAVVHGANSTSPAGPTANSTAVENVVKGYAPGIKAANLVVTSTWPDGSNAFGNRVTVVATYNYNSAIAWIIGITTIPLRATTTMEISH
jgi:Flp pilus assembly protein TadG